MAEAKGAKKPEGGEAGGGGSATGASGAGEAGVPSLANLSLAKLSQKATDTSGLLVWRVSSSSIGLSYFEAIEKSIASASQPNVPALYITQRTALQEEHKVHLAWLRACHVPSAMSVDRGRLTGSIKEIDNSDDPRFSMSINRVNAVLDAMEQDDNVTVPRVEPFTTKSIIAQMNVANGAELQPPYFKTLNADSSRTKFNATYIKAFTDMQANDGFTDLELPVPKLTNVAHIVPKAWLRTCNALAEFDGAHNNPTNVIVTRKEFNSYMGTSAIYLGKILGVESKYWAPAGFTEQSKAAVARAVACVALTYPFTSSSEEAIVGGAGRTGGMPLFYNQRQDIVRLLAVKPSDDEYDRAMLQFAVFNWTNPLTVSTDIRTKAADPSSQLHKLLMDRLGGTDLGSKFAAEAMRNEDIDFNMPFFNDSAGSGTVSSVRESKERKRRA